MAQDVLGRRVDVPLRVMQLAGLWPHSSWAHVGYRALMLANEALVISGIFGHLMHAEMPPEIVIVQTAYAFATVSNFCPIIPIYVENGQPLRRLLASLSDRLNWNKIPSQNLWLLDSVKRFYVSFLGSTVAVSWIMAAAHFIKADGELLVPTWFPFDVTDYYVVMMLSQLMSTLFLVLSLGGVALLYVTVVLLICAQIQSLHTKLIALHGGSRREELDHCVRWHQEILRCIELLKIAYSPMFLAYFLASMLSISCVVFSAVMAKEITMDLCLSAGIAGCTVLWPLSIFCWFGTELSTQASLLRSAAYGCAWYENPVLFRPYVLTITSRCDIEEDLTAGGFVPVTLNTLVKILQESLSYMMVMSSITSSSS